MSTLRATQALRAPAPADLIFGDRRSGDQVVEQVRAARRKILAVGGLSTAAVACGQASGPAQPVSGAAEAPTKLLVKIRADIRDSTEVRGTLCFTPTRG